MAEDDLGLLTPARVARMIGCDRQVVYGLVRRGELRSLRIGSGPKAPIRIPTEALERFLLARATEA